MTRARWLLVLLLAGCAPQDPEQQNLRAQVSALETRTITATCPGGTRTVELLGEGFFLRSDNLVFICTVLLAGGLTCRTKDAQRVLDFEQRTALFVSPSGAREECRI